MPIPEIGQDTERLVQDQNGVLDHRRPEEHGIETFFLRQGGISFLRNRVHPHAVEETIDRYLGLMPGHILVILSDQGNIAPDGQVRDEGRLQRDEAQPRLVSRDEIPQFLLKLLFAFEEPQMNLTIDDSTSMIMMAEKTFTIPLSTATGMFVSSCEAFMPRMTGIRVMKKPKAAHLNHTMIMSNREAGLNRGSI